MARDDDDLPTPDAPASGAEQARATSFAALVDDMLADRPAPPALDADDRALIETAAIVRAGAGRGFALPEGASRRAIDAALAQAIGAPRLDATPPGSELAARRARPRAAGPWAPWAPWTIAAIASAAAVLLALRPPAPPPGDGRADAAPRATTAQRSRPADALVGVIPRAAAGDASQRLDAIYADRLAGFRAARLRTFGARASVSGDGDGDAPRANDVDGEAPR